MYIYAQLCLKTKLSVITSYCRAKFTVVAQSSGAVIVHSPHGTGKVLHESGLIIGLDTCQKGAFLAFPNHRRKKAGGKGDGYVLSFVYTKTESCGMIVPVRGVLGFDWDDENREKCQKHGVSVAQIESLFLFFVPLYRPRHQAFWN
jgi:hypothetical protein